METRHKGSMLHEPQSHVLPANEIGRCTTISRAVYIKILVQTVSKASQFRYQFKGRSANSTYGSNNPPNKKTHSISIK